MSYTVVWARTAEVGLTEIWLSATDRAAVSKAADHLDQHFNLTLI